MSTFSPNDNNATSLLSKVALGFFGVIAARKLLPKAAGLAFNRWTFRLVNQIVFVALAALLTDKLAKKLTGHDEFGGGAFSSNFSDEFSDDFGDAGFSDDPYRRS